MTARDDFYAPRRGAMADTGAYAGFLLGFFGAAPFGWNALTSSFEDYGDATMGVIRFAGTLIVAGLVTGVAGYAVGALTGRLWEARHRAANPRVKPEAGPDMATLTAARPEDTVAAVARAWQRQAKEASRASAAPGTDAAERADTPSLDRFESPDELREFRHGRLELVRSAGTVLGRLTCAAGWRWSRDIGAMLQVERHREALAGLVLEGSMQVTSADGVVHALVPGTIFDLPPAAHDLEVIGPTPVVAILFSGAERFAPHPSHAPVA